HMTTNSALLQTIRAHNSSTQIPSLSLPVRKNVDVAQADMNNFLYALASSSGTDLALARDAEGFRASGHSRGELFENLPVHSRHFQQPGDVGKESARLPV